MLLFQFSCHFFTLSLGDTFSMKRGLAISVVGAFLLSCLGVVAINGPNQALMESENSPDYNSNTSDEHFRVYSLTSKALGPVPGPPRSYSNQHAYEYKLDEQTKPLYSPSDLSTEQEVRYSLVTPVYRTIRPTIYLSGAGVGQVGGRITTTTAMDADRSTDHMGNPDYDFFTVFVNSRTHKLSNSLTLTRSPAAASSRGSKSWIPKNSVSNAFNNMDSRLGLPDAISMDSKGLVYQYASDYSNRKDMTTSAPLIHSNNLPSMLITTQSFVSYVLRTIEPNEYSALTASRGAEPTSSLLGSIPGVLSTSSGTIPASSRERSNAKGSEMSSSKRMGSGFTESSSHHQEKTIYGNVLTQPMIVDTNTPSDVFDISEESSLPGTIYWPPSLSVTPSTPFTLRSPLIFTTISSTHDSRGNVKLATITDFTMVVVTSTPEVVTRVDSASLQIASVTESTSASGELSLSNGIGRVTPSVWLFSVALLVSVI